MGSAPSRGPVHVWWEEVPEEELRRRIRCYRERAEQAMRGPQGERIYAQRYSYEWGLQSTAERYRRLYALIDPDDRLSDKVRRQKLQALEQAQEAQRKLRRLRARLEREFTSGSMADANASSVAAGEGTPKPVARRAVTPEERSLIGQVAAYSRLAHPEFDLAPVVKQLQAGAWNRYLTQVDPEGVLPEVERNKKARAARRAELRKQLRAAGKQQAQKRARRAAAKAGAQTRATATKADNNGPAEG